MGIFDRSRSVTELNEENYSEVINTNIGFQDVAGLAVGQAGGDIEIAIDQVDSGIVAASRDISLGAIALTGDVAAGAMRAGAEALEFGERVTDRSLTTTYGIASDSIAAQRRLAEYAIGQSSAQQRQTADVLSSAIVKAADATRSDTSNVLNNIVKFGSLVALALAGLYIYRRASA